MKRPQYPTLYLSVLSAIMLATITGCGEYRQAERRTKLVANQNLELRNLLKLREEKIHEQQGQIDQCQEQKNNVELQAGKTAEKMMEMLTETLIQVEELTREKDLLKAKLRELEGEPDLTNETADAQEDAQAGSPK